MSDAENPTAEREAESSPAGHLSPRASSALGKAGDPVKKCSACGRKQPFKRTRCVSCGANLPAEAFDESKADESKDGASAPAAEAPKAEKAPEAAAAPAPAPEKPPAAPAPAPDAPPEPRAAEPKAAEPKAAEQPRAEEPRPAEPSGSEVTLESLIKAAAGDTPPPPPADPEPPAAPAVAEAPAVEAPKEKAPEKAVEEPHHEAPKAEPKAPHAPTPAPGAKKLAAPVAPRPAGAPPASVGAAVKAEVAPLFTKAVEHLDGKIATTAKAVDHVEHQLKAGLGLVAKGQHGLQEKVTLVARALEELAKDATKRRKDYDALYAEMRDYKVNFIDQAQKPLFNDLLLLFDSILRISRNVEDIKESTIPKEAVSEAFKQVKDELVEILYRRDIEMIEDHPKKLDVSFQKPVRRVETDNAEEDKQVVQCVREGFKRNGVVFRPQEVVVKRCARVAQSDEQPIQPQTEEPAPAAAPAETAVNTETSGKKEE
ncbi:MAG TPA: nucleotide exchange factor GrpE [Planctomycetota bacterium]|nr:nucleotide exchange factor GrpE [Planctomycetota bacterium]